jgi:hypothetical protein
MICSTVHLASSTQIQKESYIDHQDYPGGPIVYQAEVLVRQPTFTLGVLAAFSINWLVSAAQVNIYFFLRENR